MKNPDHKTKALVHQSFEVKCAPSEQQGPKTGHFNRYKKFPLFQSLTVILHQHEPIKEEEATMDFSRTHHIEEQEMKNREKTYSKLIDSFRNIYDY